MANALGPKRPQHKATPSVWPCTYALGVTPLLRKLYQKCANTTQIWFADDSAAASSLTNHCEWQESLVELGPCFGNEVNVNKCWLVVKPHLVEQARNLFHNTGIQITNKGCPYLGVAVGQQCFLDKFVSSQVFGWIKSWTHSVTLLIYLSLMLPTQLSYMVSCPNGLIFNAQFLTYHTYSNPWRKPFVTGCYHPSQAKQL